MGFNVGKAVSTATKKVTAPIAKAVTPGATAANHVLNTTAPGKAFNVMSGGSVGGILSAIQGKNPLANTPAGDLMTAAGVSGGTSKSGPAGPVGGVSPLDKVNQLMPNYISPLNPDGTLNDKYKSVASAPVAAGQVAAGSINAGKLDVAGLSPDQAALNAIKTKAMATGPSAWADLANKQVDLSTLANKDTAGAQALSGAASARSALAMHGGLGGGAAERIAAGASRDMNASRQAAQRAGDVSHLNVGMTDEANKNSMLMAVPGMDLANAGFKADLSKFNVGTDMDAQKYNTGMAFDAAKTNAANNLQSAEYNSSQNFAANQQNTTNALLGLGGENAFNMGKYGQQMAGYGAGQTGQAIASGGKK